MPRRGLFDDDLRCKTQLAYEMVMTPNGYKPTGKVKGVHVIIPCPECGAKTKILYSWQEIYHLLSGKQLQGVARSPSGWQAQSFCAREECRGLHGRTVIKYSMSVRDLRDHYDNMAKLGG